MFERLSLLTLAALPIVELRGSIPYGILVLSLGPVEVFWLSIVGNLLPVIVLLIFLPIGERVARKYSVYFDRFFTWWFHRVYSHNEVLFKKWGALALIILVAIPIPMTGAWTGSVVAYLFKIDRLLAFLYITIGVIMAGGIVTFLTLSGIKLF